MFSFEWAILSCFFVCLVISFSFFFFLSLTFETSDGVTLEIRFSFPGLLIFCVFGGFFVVVVAVVQSEDQPDV